MKNLLLFAFMLLAGQLKAQVSIKDLRTGDSTDSNGVFYPGQTYKGYTINKEDYSKYQWLEQQTKPDTIKCNLLVSDNDYPMSSSFVVKGYYVVNGFSFTPYYLDDHKKKLNRNFIVWQAKERK